MQLKIANFVTNLQNNPTQNNLSGTALKNAQFIHSKGALELRRSELVKLFYLKMSLPIDLVENLYFR